LNVRRLEVFGSAARGDDFELAKSDVERCVLSLVQRLLCSAAICC
jgi:predicted nucleotidyltransferase